MTDTPMSLPSLQARFRTRSMGVKLVVVCALALVMTIPALFVEGIVEERTQRASEVTREIGSHVGGRQKLLGPTLAIPYTRPRTDHGKHTGTRYLFGLPCTGRSHSQDSHRRATPFAFQGPCLRGQRAVRRHLRPDRRTFGCSVGSRARLEPGSACRRCSGCPQGHSPMAQLRPTEKQTH